jgi:hypothetical protein
VPRRGPECIKGSGQIVNTGALVLTWYYFAEAVQRLHESDWLGRPQAGSAVRVRMTGS